MKRSRSIFLLFFYAALMLGMTHISFGQTEKNSSPFGYSVPMQRLQLKLTTSFVYFQLHRTMDLDSATILVSEAEHLPHALSYDEDYREGTDNEIKTLLNQANEYLFRTGTSSSDLNHTFQLLQSAQQLVDKEGSLFWKNAILATWGKYYLQNREPDKSKASFTQAVELARTANDKAILQHALANRGTNANYGDAQKEKDLTEALDLTRQLRDTVREIEMLTRIYEIYFVQGKMDTVKTQLLHVTELEKQIGFKHIHYNYAVLGYLDFALWNIADVFKNQRTAISIMEANKDLAFSNFFYGALAHTYTLFDNVDKAMEWLEKGLQQESANKVKRIWYNLFYGTVQNFARNGYEKKARDLILKTIAEYPPLSSEQRMQINHLLGCTYFYLNQLDMSKKYFDLMVPEMDSVPVNDQVQRGNKHIMYIDVARYHMAVGNVPATKRFFEKAKMYADTTLINDVYRIHDVQFKIDSVEGKYLNAMRESYLRSIATDSIYQMNRLNQIELLQAEFDTETKDKNIELLVQKDIAQQASLDQSRLTRNATLAGILVMIVITALLYNQYRNKQKASEAMNAKNVALEQLVKDKEWLVKEIHHRVKNNFHIVTGLLDIQSSYLKNKDALSAIKESQNRIHSMSIIHQKLYQSETLSTIQMPEYIYELVEYLRESYGIRERISFEVFVDKIELDHASAITLGLILNEAITNAIKYAFADNKEGKIEISLTYVPDSQIQLCIADNGPGLPKDFNVRIGTSMGMELLQGLAGDIGGVFTIETHQGTRIKIIFTDKPSSARKISVS